jgi:hypothetical protein
VSRVDGADQAVGLTVEAGAEQQRAGAAGGGGADLQGPQAVDRDGLVVLGAQRARWPAGEQPVRVDPAVPEVAGVTIRQVKGSRLLSVAWSVSANGVGLPFTDIVNVMLAPSAITGGAECTYVTVLSVMVAATFAFPAASDATFAGIVAITVPDAVMPLTATL